MITEHASLDIVPGREADFEEAFQRGRALLLASPGCRTVRLLHGVEQLSRYLLLVEWETLEDHTVTFRGSPSFTAWREIVGPFFDRAPEVEHYH